MAPFLFLNLKASFFEPQGNTKGYQNTDKKRGKGKLFFSPFLPALKYFSRLKFTVTGSPTILLPVTLEMTNSVR